jgi:predicted  nucleic acid-binding Zn-ribbon protein
MQENQPKDKIIILKDEIEKIKTNLQTEKLAHRNTKEKHGIFRDSLADLYGSAHTEESILKFANENSNAIDDRDKYKDLYEREVQAHQLDIVKYQAELERFKKEIAGMREEKIKMEAQVQVDNEVFQKRIDTIEDKIDYSVQKKAEAVAAVEQKVTAVRESISTKLKNVYNKIVQTKD